MVTGTARPLQTRPITIHCAAKLNAQCNYIIYANLTRINGGSQQKDCLYSRLTRVIHWLTDFLMEMFIGLFTTLTISADLPMFDFRCVAQLLSDIDVFPAEPSSVESKLVNISFFNSPGRN